MLLEAAEGKEWPPMTGQYQLGMKRQPVKVSPCEEGDKGSVGLELPENLDGEH